MTNFYFMLDHHFVNTLKVFILLTFFSLLYSQKPVNAQTPDSSFHSNKSQRQYITDTNFNQKTIYSTLSFLAPGIFFYPKTNGQLNIVFPYSSTNLAGNITQNTFNSSIKNAFSQNSFILGLADIEVGTSKRFLNLSAALNVTYFDGVNFAFGYGYNLYLEKWRFHLYNIQQSNANIIIKASINLGYYSLSSKNIGVIDNQNKHVSLLGYTANPTWTTNANSSPNTYQAQEIDIGYEQNDIAIIPKIGISNNPFKHIFHWELNFSGFIPIREKGGLTLTQTSETFSNPLTHSRVIGLNQDGISATFNDKPINKSPFSFPGLYVSLNIGFGKVFPR